MLDKITPVAFKMPSDTTSFPPPRSIGPVSVMASWLSSLMSKVSVPPVSETSTSRSILVFALRPTSRASMVRFPSPIASILKTWGVRVPSASVTSRTTCWPAATFKVFVKRSTTVCDKPSRTKVVAVPLTVATISPTAVPPNETSEATSSTVKVGASEPPQAASGRRSSGSRAFLFFLAIFLAHCATNLARAAGVPGRSTTSTIPPAEAT